MLWLPLCYRLLQFFQTAEVNYKRNCCHCILKNSFFPFFSESGFIYDVSPMKTKTKKGTQYYHYTLQTSPTKTWRVVGFWSSNTQSVSALWKNRKSSKATGCTKCQGRKWSVMMSISPVPFRHHSQIVAHRVAPL